MRKSIGILLAIVLTSTVASFSNTQANPTSDQSKLVLVKTISGNISPKSVKSSGTGLVSAHNMMYRHSVTLYDSNTQELLKTIPDSVTLVLPSIPGYIAALPSKAHFHLMASTYM
jgi:hypothetical protein